jgi:AraC family transcriptional regulator
MLNTHLMNDEAMAPARSSLAPWKIRCVQAFIAVNLRSALRVMDIARAANCGRTQLKRAFEESLGCTPNQYITRRRVARAQNLMLLSNDSLCDIAAECGFANVRALSRLFRRIVGESPRTWRLVHASVLSVPAGVPIYGTTNSARRQQHFCDKRG